MSSESSTMTESFMTTPRTSIIMPVYNTADTVVRAIDSVLAQTDPDFELLIMIDGSPDNSAQVITEYLERNPDERIRVFNNSENKGLSAMRNQGLDNAQGEWVVFPDSDDALYPAFLERLHHHAEVTGADIVNCAHDLVTTLGEKTVRLKGKPGIRTGVQAAYELLQDQLSPYAWDKIIRRSLFSDIRYPNIQRAEDECALLKCYLAAQSVSVIDESLYAYSASPGSLTWSRITPISETYRLIAYFEDALNEHLQKPQAQQALTAARVIAFLNNAQQALIVGGENAEETIRACRSGFSYTQALTVARTRWIFGAAGTLLKLSPRLYRTLYGTYVKRTYGL